MNEIDIKFLEDSFKKYYFNQDNLNKLVTFYVQNTHFSLAPKESITWSIIKKYRNKIRTANLNFDFIDTLGFAPEYFECEFSLADLVNVSRFNKLLEENFIDPRICLTSNIKSHVKFLKFFILRISINDLTTSIFFLFEKKLSIDLIWVNALLKSPFCVNTQAKSSL